MHPMFAELFMKPDEELEAGDRRRRRRARRSRQHSSSGTGAWMIRNATGGMGA